VRPDSGREGERDRHGQGYPGGRPPKRAPRPDGDSALTLWSTALAADVAYVSRIRRVAKEAWSVIPAPGALIAPGRGRRTAPPAGAANGGPPAGAANGAERV